VVLNAEKAWSLFVITIVASKLLVAPSKVSFVKPGPRTNQISAAKRISFLHGAAQFVALPIQGQLRW